MDARVARRGSCGSSDASSEASGVSSSHRSRGRPRAGESDKSRSLDGQLEEMLSSVNERTVIVHSNVSALQAPRLETGSASTSGSTPVSARSGCATSAETVRYNPHSWDDPSTRTSINSSTVRRSRTIPEQTTSGISLRAPTTPERTTDSRTPTTTPPHTRNVQDVVQTHFPNITVELPERQGGHVPNWTSTMPISGGAAYDPGDRVLTHRRAEDIARGTRDAQEAAQPNIRQQGQQLLMAAQVASLSALQLAEANACSQDLRETQLRYIEQAESQRVAMISAANPNVYNRTGPPPPANHTTPGDSSVSHILLHLHRHPSM
jgi:hypothetical protein